MNFRTSDRTTAKETNKMSSQHSKLTEETNDGKPLDELLSGWWDTTITGDIESEWNFTWVEENAIVGSRSLHSTSSHDERNKRSGHQKDRSTSGRNKKNGHE